MRIVVRRCDDRDLMEAARLTYEAQRVELGRGESAALEEIADLIRSEFTELPRVAVLAYSAERLIGWLMIVEVGHAAAEINPGFLGGHPIVLPGNNVSEVGAELLREARHWAEERGIDKLSLDAPMAARFLHDEDSEAWYETRGFHVHIRYVDMMCDLSQQVVTDVEVPEEFRIRPLGTASDDDLYACYHDAFAHGDARFFFDQTAEERRAFFDALGLQEARSEVSSVVLRRDGRIVGFTSVLPYGPKNCHISCMCVRSSYQGRGLGQLLLRLVMKEAGRQGCRTITLGTEAQMRACALYQKNGFRVTKGRILYRWRKPARRMTLA